jgi:hypothetical protein
MLCQTTVARGTQHSARHMAAGHDADRHAYATAALAASQQAVLTRQCSGRLNTAHTHTHARAHSRLLLPTLVQCRAHRPQPCTTCVYAPRAHGSHWH